MTGRIATRFFLRLSLLQAALPAFSTALTLALAPRALLLDRSDPSLGLWEWLAEACVIAAAQAVITALLVRPLAPTLRALADDASTTLPANLARLDALPARLVSALAAVSGAIGLGSTHPALRPATHDFMTQATLALFHFAVVAAAALPLYVLLRSTVARVLERAPFEITAEALRLEASPSRAFTRVRTRFLLAVAGPVAFIALGASLLAFAHVRVASEELERQTAEAVAAGALDSVGGSPAGRDAAIAAAQNFGIRVRVDPVDTTGVDLRASDDATLYSFALVDGTARVELPGQPLGHRTAWYAFLVLLAALVAGLLGAYVGRLYSADLSLARETIDRTGVYEVMGGGFFVAEPRFTSVAQLLEAVGQLGLRFREFGAAHEQATTAKETTERMRALFLAAMSHDLKAPLNSILGFAALVGRSPLAAEQMQSLAIIEQRGRELLHLIQTILDAARAEAGELTITPEDTNIGDIVMSAVLDARDLALGSEVAIQAEVQPAMPAIPMDTQRMVQALLGVIGAAVRFTEKGNVNVRATHGPNILIDVETAGRGLHPGEREKIFEAFKYPDRARRLGSLGLELSLARAIVERHQGIIDVDVPQGGGIVFHVRLPTDDAPVSMPRPSVRPRPQ